MEAIIISFEKPKQFLTKFIKKKRLSLNICGKKTLKCDKKCNKMRFIWTGFSAVSNIRNEIFRVGSEINENLYVKKNKPYFL
jgi:hypothetical protein